MGEKEKEKEKGSQVQLLVRAVVTSPDGKVLYDTGEKKSKSFVIQFLEFFYGLFRGITFNATAVGGGERNITNVLWFCEKAFRLEAGVGVATYGIVVGTGTSPVTNTDFKLDTQLGEGTGGGQITHGAMIVGTTAVVGSNVDLETKRTFTNSTGSTITVRECGAIIRGDTADDRHLIIRDLFGTPVDVPDKCSITVYYTFRTTV